MFLRSSRNSSKNASSSRRSAFAGFVALPACERRIVLAVAALLPMTTIALRVLGLGRALTFLRRTSSRRPTRPEVRPLRLGALVHAAAERLPFPSSCLQRSVVLTWLLSRRGFRAVLVIEAALGHQPFQAHAWVDTGEGPIGRSTGPSAEIARWTLPESEAS